MSVKINYYNNKKLNINQIGQGETFIFNEDLYMKTPSLKTDNNHIINAIRLCDGSIIRLDDLDSIELVNVVIDVNNLYDE